MKKNNINYDSKNDVLYISFGDPRPSYAETYDDGIYVRYDMDTDELSGITIVDFTKRAKELKDLHLPGNINFDEMSNLMH